MHNLEIFALHKIILAGLGEEETGKVHATFILRLKETKPQDKLLGQIFSGCFDANVGCCWLEVCRTELVRWDTRMG